MLTLKEVQYITTLKLDDQYKVKSEKINKLIRAIVRKREKNDVVRYASNASRKAAYNKLKEKVYEQVCIEFRCDPKRNKELARKYLQIKYPKKRVYLTFGNLMSLDQEKYDHTIQILERMLKNE